MRYFCGILILLCALSASAVDRITATVTITNTAGTTNGQTFTVNGNVRTFTNVVYTAVSEVLTNSTHLGSKTNLFNAISSVPFNSVTLLNLGTNQFSLIGAAGTAMTVTPSAGYATVTYSTQLVSSMTGVRVPIAGEPTGAAQTSIASLLTLGIWTYSTNAIEQSSITASNLLGTTNAQTVAGAKQFTNTAGAFYGYVSNSTGISGTVATLTNGSWRSGILISPTLTNGLNYGNAFRSPGSGSFSEQFGTDALAIGTVSTAVGYGAIAYADQSIAVGTAAEALPNAADSVVIGVSAQALTNASGSLAIGRNAIAWKPNSSAIGNAANAIYTNSTAIGYSANSTASNQVRLGTASDHVSIAGGLKVDGVITNAVFGNTNSFPAGSDISFGRYSLSSLANGNNAGIVVGTNVFIQVSGPSAAFAINGIDGGRDGKLIVILNYTGFDMSIAHDSGVDATAANRIYNLTGADRTTTGNGAATLIYSGSASRWILISFDP